MTVRKGTRCDCCQRLRRAPSSNPFARVAFRWRDHTLRLCDECAGDVLILFGPGRRKKRPAPPPAPAPLPPPDPSEVIQERLEREVKRLGLPLPVPTPGEPWPER